jgi:predicted NAD/FAD-dependent oxidoreductase
MALMMEAECISEMSVCFHETSGTISSYLPPKEPEISLNELTPRNTALLEKLAVTQLAIYGTRKVITIFTTDHHWTYPDPVKSSLHPTLRRTLILPPVPRSPNWSLSFGFFN